MSDLQVILTDPPFQLFGLNSIDEILISDECSEHASATG